jgi:hypothetical protein
VAVVTHLPHSLRGHLNVLVVGMYINHTLEGIR